MKNLKFLFVAVLALLALAVPLVAQEAGPQLISAYTNAGTFAVASGQTTNLTAGQKVKLRLNGEGFAFSCLLGSTNATTTTNILIRFEYSVDGTNGITNLFQTFCAVPVGVGAVSVGTNFVDTLNKNYDTVAIHSIINSNHTGGVISNLNVFFTNLVLRVNKAR